MNACCLQSKYHCCVATLIFVAMEYKAVKSKVLS